MSTKNCFCTSSFHLLAQVVQTKYNILAIAFVLMARVAKARFLAVNRNRLTYISKHSMPYALSIVHLENWHICFEL